MSTQEIYFRVEEILFIQAENKYKLYLAHEIDHSGYQATGTPTVIQGGVNDDFHYKITCHVAQSGGTPDVHVNVYHEPELPNFVLEEDDEYEYIFDIFVQEGENPVDWEAESGTPPKERAKVKKKNIRTMPIKTLDKN
jgi:hypothetical protein